MDKTSFTLNQTTHPSPFAPFCQRGVLEGCDSIINVQHPEATVMFAPFKDMAVPDVDVEAKEEMRQRALDVIEKSVIPAFVKLRIFVENVSFILVDALDRYC